MSTTITLRLNDELANIIEKHIELNEWQISQTVKAIEEADKGNFASDQFCTTTIK